MGERNDAADFISACNEIAEANSDRRHTAAERLAAEVKRKQEALLEKADKVQRKYMVREAFDELVKRITDGGLVVHEHQVQAKGVCSIRFSLKRSVVPKGINPAVAEENDAAAFGGICVGSDGYVDYRSGGRDWKEGPLAWFEGNCLGGNGRRMREGFVNIIGNLRREGYTLTNG